MNNKENPVQKPSRDWGGNLFGLKRRANTAEDADKPIVSKNSPRPEVNPTDVKGLAASPLLDAPPF